MPSTPISGSPPKLIRRLLLTILLAFAFGFRIAALDTYGFSEDEAAKLLALDAYARGEFWANAEHPMLMKLAIGSSLAVSRTWNTAVPSIPIAPEAALRLPNVLGGTATVAVVYGIGGLFFGPVTGLAAAATVALDPNVTALNRLGKEDTLMVLFLMVAMCCYERAKIVGASDPSAAQSWYSASGAAFGLMFASKYVPWFFGLYALFNHIAMRHAGANAPRKASYYGLMLAAFLALNPAILSPDTWAYCLAYVRGDHVTHHGYAYAGELHVNAATVLLHGVPVTYYLDLIASKVPLVVLAAAAIGLVPLFRARRQRGFIWLRVFLILPLVGYSVFAGKFQRYAIVSLVVIDLLAAVGLVALARWLWAREWPRHLRIAACAAAFLALVLPLLSAQLGAAPFYSAFQNAIGAARGAPVTTFPEEAYDYGVREAVFEIAGAAAPGAAIVSDAPMVVAHYVGRTGREDLETRSLSQEGLRAAGEQWVIVQDGHLTFENASQVRQLRQGLPWREYRLNGTVVLRVFRVVR